MRDAVDMLTAQQRIDFERDGIVRISGAFSGVAAERMQAVVWRELARRYAVDRDIPTTWPRSAATGLKSSKKHREFDAILSQKLSESLDVLFGSGEWTRPKAWGNVLVTFRDADVWTVPHRVWHSDFPPTLCAEKLDVVKVWSLISHIEPSGGGTPHIAGSHRLFARWLANNPERDYKRAKFGFLKSHPWLRELSSDSPSHERTTRLMRESDIDGLPARVVETIGQPGDVWITHPWVFHSIACNARDEPRMQRSTAVWRRSARSADPGGIEGGD